MKLFKVPTESATDYAYAHYRAWKGPLGESCRLGCIYDGASKAWWPLVWIRVRRLTKRIARQKKRGK